MAPVIGLRHLVSRVTFDLHHNIIYLHQMLHGLFRQRRASVAGVVELVDTQGLGSCGFSRPWRFKSSHPHHPCAIWVLQWQGAGFCAAQAAARCGATHASTSSGAQTPSMTSGICDGFQRSGVAFTRTDRWRVLASPNRARWPDPAHAMCLDCTKSAGATARLRAGLLEWSGRHVGSCRSDQQCERVCAKRDAC